MTAGLHPPLWRGEPRGRAARVSPPAKSGARTVPPGHGAIWAGSSRRRVIARGKRSWGKRTFAEGPGWGRAREQRQAANGPRGFFLCAKTSPLRVGRCRWSSPMRGERDSFDAATGGFGARNSADLGGPGGAGGRMVFGASRRKTRGGRVVCSRFTELPSVQPLSGLANRCLVLDRRPVGGPGGSGRLGPAPTALTSSTLRGRRSRGMGGARGCGRDE